MLKKMFLLICLLSMSIPVFAGSLQVIGQNDLMKIVKSYNEKTMVVFWAP